MTEPTPKDPPEPMREDGGAPLRAGLQRLAKDDPQQRSWHLGTRLRNYFLTGLVVVGPVALTISFTWWLVHYVDAWIKPLLPDVYNPDKYLPFPIPGLGLFMAFVALTLIGALAANLLGRTLISFGEMMVERMPIVRNVYRALKQIFESVVTVTNPSPGSGFQRVGLIEFPSKGLWSLVFVTGETSGEIATVAPGGQKDLLTVWVPTGIVPPTGFICFLPRDAVTFLAMSMEDAAKIIISGGMVMPDVRERLKEIAEASGGKAPPVPVPVPAAEAQAPAEAAAALVAQARKAAG
jgi:uncharacterized membrane protein